MRRTFRYWIERLLLIRRARLLAVRRERAYCATRLPFVELAIEGDESWN